MQLSCKKQMKNRLEYLLRIDSGRFFNWKYLDFERIFKIM